MESIARKLREGRVAESSAAPLVLVVDDVHAPTAPVVFRKVLHMLISAVEAGRAQAKQVALIALDNPPASLCTPSAVTSCIDMFSAANMTMTQLQQELAATLQRAGPHTTCVVLDSLPALCFDAAHLTTMLADLCNHPHVSSVLAHVHKDLLDAPNLQHLLRLCSSWLELAPCSATEQRWAAMQGLVVHGTATARHKRAAGRVRVEADGYANQHDGLRLMPPPTAPSSAAEAAAMALRKGPSAAPAGDVLAAQERESRSAVVLPYERRVAAAEEADWRDRLPRAAGGRGAATHAGLPGTAESDQLGHIDYTRDTDEEVDSDEDPDDDLDV